MRLTIVIPVLDDPLLARCLESVDNDVEIVVVLNGSSQTTKRQVKKLIQRFTNLKVYNLKKPSIARAYNLGIKQATYDQVLLMDSDCVFKPDTIDKLSRNLKDNLLSKGRVVFTGTSRLNKLVAKARAYHTSDKINAYSPPLLLHKKVKQLIGGYYFHPSLCWLEDSEFNRRVEKANLKIAYDPTAVVYHTPLTPLQDLRSAFWYGVGHRIGYELNINRRPTGLVGSLRKYLIDGSRSKGFTVGMYLCGWKTVVYCGYLTQRFLRLREK